MLQASALRADEGEAPGVEEEEDEPFASAEGAPASAAGLLLFGAGAGAGASGTSLPKIDSGRRTLETSYRATGGVVYTLLVIFVFTDPEVIPTTPLSSVKSRESLEPPNVWTGPELLRFVNSDRL